MNKTTVNSEKSKTEYISNPFKSSFDGMSRLFKLSQTTAIILLVLGLFGFVFNTMGTFPIPIDTPEESNTVTVTENKAQDSYTIDLDKTEKQSEKTQKNTAIDSRNDEAVDNVAIIMILTLVAGLVITVLIISTVISVIWTGTVNYVAWKNSKNQEANLGEAISASFKRFWTILWLQIVVGIKIIFGFIFFIIPGVRAALRYDMVYIAMFDENLNAKQSIARIKSLTKQHLMEVFGILTVSQLLFPVAILVQIGGQSILYPQLKELKDNNLPKPKTHWLNYLGLILAGMLFVFILSIVSLIFALAN